MSDPEIQIVDHEKTLVQNVEGTVPVIAQPVNVPETPPSQESLPVEKESIPEFEGTGKSFIEKNMDKIMGWALIRFAPSGMLLEMKRKMLEKKSQQSGGEVKLEDKKYGS